jgi:hypothetical protein
MRQRIEFVTLAVSKLVTLPGYPDDKLYLALTYGMIAASKGNRQLTRVQIEARLIAWVMHFEKGVKLLPEGHEAAVEMTTALDEVKKWVRLPVEATDEVIRTEV